MKEHLAPGDIPFLTTEQMREADRAMVEDYHIELIQMMENAGRHLAALARSRFLGGAPTGKRIVVLTGRGGNGGGALVCARRLHGWGAAVQIFLSRPPEAFDGVPQHQLEILRRVGVPILTEAEDTEQVDLIIDGLIGYGLSGPPRGPAADLIRWANAQRTPILALDTPSGVETTTGRTFDPAIRASATLTLALPKVGLRAPAVRSHVGELYLADIGVPPELYAEFLNLEVGPIFARSE
ncbi:MAG: NAD(P)H-hydrate epimerase, partial [Anaerolineae bacterium]